MDRVWRPKPTAMIWVSVSYAVWSISARACAVSSRSTRIFVPTLPHSSSIHSNSSRTLSWRSSADSFACVSPFSFLSTPPARYSIYHSSRLFIHVHFCCKVGQEFLKTWDRIKESMAFAKEKLDIAYIWAKNMVRFIGPSVVLLWPVYYIIRYRWTKFLRYPLSYQFNSLLIGKKNRWGSLSFDNYFIPDQDARREVMLTKKADLPTELILFPLMEHERKKYNVVPSWMPNKKDLGAFFWQALFMVDLVLIFAILLADFMYTTFIHTSYSSVIAFFETYDVIINQHLDMNLLNILWCIGSNIRHTTGPEPKRSASDHRDASDAVG